MQQQRDIWEKKEKKNLRLKWNAFLQVDPGFHVTSIADTKQLFGILFK